LIPYLVVGMVAIAATFVATPVVRWLVVKADVIDRPNDRKVHAYPTPTLGGVAMFIGMMAAGAAAYYGGDFVRVFGQSSEVWGIAAGAGVILLLGVVDDIRDLPAPVKLAGQVFASGILFLSGVKMQFIITPDQTIFLGDDVSVLITIVWLVAMINAVNLVDGLDGLAAGIVAIAAASFFVYSYNQSGTDQLVTNAAPMIAMIILGSTLGFLRFNFHPAKIFMGDSGSMLLGLVLGATTIIGVGKAGMPVPTTSDVFLAYFPLLIPLMVLALPFLDVVLAIIRRIRGRRSVVHADKEHLHHRLMDLGHGHRKAVLVMYVWSALAGGAGLAFTYLDRDDVIFALPVAVTAMVVYTLFPAITKALKDRI
jgi:UDP-GlcNAc:undecaprenyl-phosphate GlcNAc-1-phosphate transferase